MFDVKLKSKALFHLRRVCGRYGIVPASYVLIGITRDEAVPRKDTSATAIWKGTYRAESIAIKVFKIAKGREDYGNIKTVRQVT